MSQDITEFLKASPVYVNSFLKTKGLFLLVPAYQREYAWSKNEVQELFDDIMTSNDGQTYFIGSVILLKMDNSDYLEIIDGQQRSTTISLMYTSLYYLSSYINILAKLVNNSDLKTDLDVLVNDLSECLIKEKKNILTLSEQKNNKSDYERALSFDINKEEIGDLDITKVIEDKIDGIDKRRKLYKNFQFIYEEIRKEILDEFYKKCIGKQNPTYLNNLDKKWVYKTESLIFNYLITNDFDSLSKQIKSLVKPGTNKESREFNEYIGILQGSILYLIKDITLNQSEIANLKKIIENFESDDNKEIAEKCSGILNTSPDELENDLENPRSKKGIYQELTEKLDEISDKDKVLVDKNILPVINIFLKEYTKSLKNIKSKLDNTALVKMTVENPSSANNLFETINHRGMPLSAMDLIKNDILRSISQEDRQKEDKDKKLNIAIEAWNRLVNNIESPDDQIRFLRHLYIATYINDDPFSMPTKSNIVNLYKEKYKVCANKYNLFKQMIDASEIYLFMTNFDMDNKTYKFNKFGNKLKEKFLDLNRVNAKPSLSMFLWLLNNNHTDINDIYKYIKIFFLKRHITNVPEVKYLDKHFKNIINVFENKPEKDKLETIKNELENEKPSIDLLKERLEGGMYDNNSEVTRYLLIELHNILSPASGSETLDLWAKNKKNDYIFTIEHIIPQNDDITEKWSDQKKSVLEWQNVLINKAENNTVFSDQDKDRIRLNHLQYLHMLGNLTMTAYNASLSDEVFSKKRDALDDDDKFIGFKNEVTLNSRLEFEVNSQPESLSSLDKFNIDIVEARGKVMVEKIISDILA